MKAILLVVVVLAACSSQPAERDVKFSACEALLSESLEGGKKQQAERECAEFVGVDPSAAVGSTDVAQATGSATSSTGSTGGSNALLYYLLMRDTFSRNSNSYYNKYPLGASNLRSPMAMSYGVTETAKGFSVPKFGSLNPVSRVSGGVPVTVVTGTMPRYSRGAMANSGHK